MNREEDGRESRWDGMDEMQYEIMRLTCKLLLLKHLWSEVVHGVGIGTCARGHTTAHHGGGIHLTTGAGGGHVSGHLLRHTRLSAGLAGIMSHAGGGHVMTWRHSRVLLHTAGMKTAWHSHHVGKIILWVDDPPEWIIDAPTLVAISCVFIWGEVWREEEES